MTPTSQGIFQLERLMGKEEQETEILFQYKIMALEI